MEEDLEMFPDKRLEEDMNFILLGLHFLFLFCLFGDCIGQVTEALVLFPRQASCSHVLRETLMGYKQADH